MKAAWMLERVMEPEVMNTVAEAVDYDQMDHSLVNQAFVEDFLAACSRMEGLPTQGIQIFDAGTGTARIPIELMRRQISATIWASDLADEMLLVASQNLRDSGLEASIQLVRCDCKHTPFRDETYHAVISNSIVHHIPQPGQVLREMCRILKPGGLLFIRDLSRPVDQQSLETIIDRHAHDANSHQRQMFRESLHAALTVAEVQQLLRELAIPDESVQMTSDRHWTIRWQKPKTTDSMPSARIQREEMFDVVDQQDRVLFQAPRSVVHAHHWLHRAAHIFVFNSQGELLIHRRSATKDEAPLKYTSSASGHLSAGEDYTTAAGRELEEELGLNAAVEFVGIFPADGAATAFEHSGLYRTVTDETPTFDPEEILSGEFRPLEEIEQMIAEDPEDFTHCFRALFRWYRARFACSESTPP